MSRFHPRCGGAVTLGEGGREARGRGGAHGGVVFSKHSLLDGETFSIQVDQGWGELTLGVTRRDPDNFPVTPCRPLEVPDAWLLSGGQEYQTGSSPTLGHLLPTIARREKRRRDENKVRSEVNDKVEKGRGWIKPQTAQAVPAITINGPTPDQLPPLNSEEEKLFAPYLHPRDLHYDLFTFEPLRPIPVPEVVPPALQPSQKRGPPGPFLKVKPGTNVGLWRDGSKVTLYHSGVPSHVFETHGRSLWAVVGLGHVDMISVLQFLVISPLEDAN